MNVIAAQVVRRRTGTIVAAGVLSALSAACVVRIFDRPAAAWAVFAAVPPVVVAIGKWSWRLRLAAYGAAVLGAAFLAGSLAGGGSPVAVIAGIRHGWSYTVSTDWPSPLRSEPIVFAVTMISVSAAAAAEIARSPRWRALPLLPPLVLGVAFSALSAEAGPPPGVLVGLWMLLAAAVLALGGDQLVRPAGRLPWRGNAASLAVLVVLGAVGSGAVALSPHADRADPRRGALHPLVSSDELNPLAQVVAERSLSPAEPRFRVDGDVVGGLFRTGVVDTFDGISWGSDLAARPVSPERIGAAGGRAVGHERIVVTGAVMRRVPLDGIPLSVDRAVATDPDRSVLLLDRPLPTGASVSVTVAAPPSAAEVPDDARSRAPNDDQAAALASLAGEIAGGAQEPLIERLRHAESELRIRFQLDPNAPSGLNIGLISFAVGNARRATEEQYVAAFALIARTLGASSRIALGYRAPGGAPSGVEITSAQASAWPEVWFDGVGWVAFDPVPNATGALPVAEAATVRVAPAAVPPQATTDAPVPAEDLPLSPASSPRGRSWVVRAGLALLGALTVVAVAGGTAVVTVLGAKRRRRRRRLAAEEPYEQVLGVWAEATDHLLDLGARLQRSQTNEEIVDASLDVLDPGAVPPLRALADLANSAAHGARPPDPVVAAHAVRLLGRLEQVGAERHGRMRRLRTGCSTRSLRATVRAFD